MSIGAGFGTEITRSAPCVQLFKRHKLLPILQLIGDAALPLQVEFELP
ncbi:hypothetical protein MKP08_01430 [Erythrobacter sp. LQ02-29]|nr:hypothetical protein [Erythrobacter sp. LQ02-29]MCP9221411.1 hypothetical protein [Erythrobacter sp. LQ02-29]